jgi:TetR/AcrR family transcriptional regulator
MSQSDVMHASGENKRPVGRPRNEGARDDDPKRTILDHAARLFSQQGYRGTSMSQIARAAGLNQSSIYYWFSSKERLLDELLMQHRITLRFAGDIEGQDAGAAVRLYAVVYNDARNLCELPIDFYELETAALDSRDCFQEFFSTYRGLREIIERIVERGVDSGEFVPVDPWNAAMMIMVGDEGLQHRYHQGRLGRRLFNADPDRQVVECTKESFASMAAEYALGRVTPDDVDMDAVRNEADSRGWL